MRDETNVVATDYNESKLGIDAARLTLLTDDAQFDAYWIPFFTPSILPLAKGNPLHSRTFTKDVEGIIDLWDNSTASELELEYNLTDAITLSLIGDLYLEGPDGTNGLYGEYRDYSSVTFKGKMSF